MILQAASLISRNPELLAAPAGNELVMLSVDAGHYYGLDPIGRRIWEFLETPATVADICARLVAEYDVEPAQCEADVLAFLDDLLAQGLIHAGAR